MVFLLCFCFVFCETNNEFLFENYFAHSLVFKTTINNESDMVFFHISHSPTVGAVAAGHKKNKITIYFDIHTAESNDKKLYIYKIYMIN